VSAFAALATPDKVATLILGGLGIGMVEGVGEWDIVASALLAEDAASITHARGKMFRSFADKTRSDRVALAACIEGSRELLPAARVAQIRQPTLIAVGTKDDIAGSPEELASLMPNAVVLDIPGRDHMLSVGDRVFKARALEFLAANPL
jgi:pimeloyl-ACP methyl ester carboxylesterase